jgi:hypothetical protein
MALSKDVNFAPLIRIAGLEWRDVDFIMNDYIDNPGSPVRPKLLDYFNVNPKLLPILKSIRFPPRLFLLDQHREILTVHIGMARIVADTLDINLSDSVLSALQHRAIEDYRKRSNADFASRAEMWEAIVHQVEPLRDEPYCLDVKKQYSDYTLNLENDETVLTSEEFTQSVGSSCFETMYNVIAIEHLLFKSRDEDLCGPVTQV